MFVEVGEMLDSVPLRPSPSGTSMLTCADSSLCQGGIPLPSCSPALFWHETAFDSILDAKLSFAVLHSPLTMLNKCVFTEHLEKIQARLA